MSHILRVGSYNQFVLEALEILLSAGSVVAPRGLTTKELIAVMFELEDPLQRTMTLRKRHANIFATIAETYWFLGGRNDLEMVRAYLPRYAEYSDDGSTLHGAYGRRARDWGGVDQLKSIYQLLKKSPDTRRAVLILFDPARDLDVESKDIPCNNWLQFIVRSEKLNLFVVQRSQDVIWGGTIDVYQWTVVQEIFAQLLDVAVGSYVHFIGSLHLYERHFDRARKILRGNCRADLLSPLRIPPIKDWDTFESILNECLNAEASLRIENQSPALEKIPRGWFRETMRALWIFFLWRAGDSQEGDRLLNRMPNCDLKIAIELYRARGLEEKGRQESVEAIESQGV